MEHSRVMGWGSNVQAAYWLSPPEKTAWRDPNRSPHANTTNNEQVQTKQACSNSEMNLPHGAADAPRTAVESDSVHEEAVRPWIGMTPEHTLKGRSYTKL
jgi:hypothetical protein